MYRLSIRAPWARSFLAAVVVAAGAVAVANPTPAAGAPAPVTFTAVADAHVEQKHPSSNYATDPLRVEFSSSASVMSFVKFTTSGLTGPVQSAKLRLRTGSNGTNQGVAVNLTGTGWTENGLTWKTAPPKGALLATAPKLPASTWVEFDVTSAVTGNGTFAFLVSKVSGSDGADVKSREQTPNGPQLVVTLADTPTTTTTTTSTTTTSTSTSTTSTSTTTTSTSTTTTSTSTTTTSTSSTSTTSTTLPPPNSGPLAVPPTNTDWRAGNAFGGGYTNYVQFHPTDPNRVLLVTDVGGIHLSTDGGTTWLPRGRPVSDHVASVAWNPARPNVAYALAGVGTAGSGGVMVSTDGGVSWAMASTVPTGHSNVTPSSDGLPTPHPRSTGQLLVVDAPGGYLYAGTYKQGLMRAALDSNGRPGPWTTIALAPSGGKPYFIRGVALDDVDPSVVYVATYGSSASSGVGKVYRVSGAGGTAPVTEELVGGPRQAEELQMLGGHLYAAANDRTGAGVGAFRLADARSAAPSTPWRRIAAGPSVTTVAYYGLEIYKRGGTTTLWVTSDNAWRPDTTTAYKFMWRGTSSDDFATDGSWVALPGNLGDTPSDIAGPNNPPQPFWGINPDYAWPGLDPGYTASGITVSPADPNTLIMAGQSAPWRTRDNGATWYPVPTGIDILVQERVTTDPGDPATVALGSVDFRGFTSDDGLQTSRYVGLALRLSGVPSGAGETWSVAIDQAAPGPNRPVYYGTGSGSGNSLGEVWVDTDPTTPTTGWTKLMGQSDSGGKRPIGLAVVRDPAAPDVPVTLAVLQNGQMLRKIGFDPETVWLPASNFTSPIVQTSWPQAVEFAWKPGMTKIYVYDRASGLWRSDDYGFSWTRLYVSPDKGTNKQGFVAVDPVNENIVYVSTSAGLSVVTNAGTAGTDGALLTPIPVPGGPGGPLAVGGDGRIYIATQPDAAGHTGQIWGSRITPEGGIALAWQNLSDDLWNNAVNDTRELAVGGNGAVYVALSGGVFVLDNPAVPD